MSLEPSILPDPAHVHLLHVAAETTALTAAAHTDGHRRGAAFPSARSALNRWP
jgi:hypothetical protein